MASHVTEQLHGLITRTFVTLHVRAEQHAVHAVSVMDYVRIHVTRFDVETAQPEQYVCLIGPC